MYGKAFVHWAKYSVSPLAARSEVTMAVGIRKAEKKAVEETKSGAEYLMPKASAGNGQRWGPSMMWSPGWTRAICGVWVPVVLNSVRVTSTWNDDMGGGFIACGASSGPTGLFLISMVSRAVDVGVVGAFWEGINSFDVDSLLPLSPPIGYFLGRPLPLLVIDSEGWFWLRSSTGVAGVVGLDADCTVCCPDAMIVVGALRCCRGDLTLVTLSSFTNGTPLSFLGRPRPLLIGWSSTDEDDGKLLFCRTSFFLGRPLPLLIGCSISRDKRRKGLVLNLVSLKSYSLRRGRRNNWMPESVKVDLASFGVVQKMIVQCLTPRPFSSASLIFLRASKVFRIFDY